MCEPVIEPVPVPDVFAAGLGKIEPFGFFTRLVFYVPDSGARVVVARLILPDTALVPMVTCLRSCGGVH